MSVVPTGPVFISYSRKDNDVMRRIIRFIQGEGIRVWLDNDKLTPGTSIWEEEIEKAIKAASAVIVVMSPDSKTSEWVRREVSLADQHHKQIFPVLVRGDEDSAITLRLITRQYVDMRQDEQEALHLLGDSLLAYLAELNTEGRNAAEPQSVQSVSETGKINPKNSIGTSSSPGPLKRSQQTKTDPITSPSQWSAVLWGTLGWAIAGAIAGFIYWTGGDYGVTIGGAVGGAIGGLVTAIILYADDILSNRKNIIWITLAWAAGVAIGWTIGESLTEATGAAIGGAIAAAIGIVITSAIAHVLSDWKRMVWITLTWAISWAIGWTISRYFQLNLDAGQTGWTIGIAITAAIAGSVTIWQMRKMRL